jgi:hypothetical protein
MSRNPLGIVSSCGGNGCSTVCPSFGRVDLLRARGLLGFTTPAPALLREVRRNPDSVEEVNDPSEEGKNEEVEEDAVQELALVNSQYEHGNATHTWGSKMLASGSTTLTVPLNAWTV